MNDVDEVTASRLIFALMRVFSASVAEMPLHRSTNVAAKNRKHRAGPSSDLFRPGNLSCSASKCRRGYSRMPTG
jgi:hypothetical protein